MVDHRGNLGQKHGIINAAEVKHSNPTQTLIFYSFSRHALANGVSVTCDVGPGPSPLHSLYLSLFFLSLSLSILSLSLSLFIYGDIWLCRL